ncbi:MAG: hypothetical protein E7550_06695 [Ruminococcaceae bacterium]|nr:hypothetical protein [Oscillospiraceae bacterium]
MRRILLSIFMLLFLVGCGEKQTVDVNLQGISFDADMTYGKYKCICNVEINGGGILEMEAKSPKSIAGTKLIFDGDKVVITYKGLEYIPEMPISNETANEIINKILGSVSSGYKQAVRTDKGFLLEGEVAGYAYSLYVTEGGLPLSLECKKANLYAEFSNVKILN